MYTARLTFMSAGGGPSFAASRCSALNFIVLNIAQSVITVIARVLDAESTAEGRGLCRVAGQIRIRSTPRTQNNHASSTYKCQQRRDSPPRRVRSRSAPSSATL